MAIQHQALSTYDRMARVARGDIAEIEDYIKRGRAIMARRVAFKDEDYGSEAFYLGEGMVDNAKDLLKMANKLDVLLSGTDAAIIGVVSGLVTRGGKRRHPGKGVKVAPHERSRGRTRFGVSDYARRWPDVLPETPRKKKGKKARPTVGKLAKQVKALLK